MLLVFALAAALCLGVFVRADHISEETHQRDQAVILACNAAELLKSIGDPGIVLELVETGEFAMKILEENSCIAGMRQAKIVISRDHAEVFSLQTGWQEVAP